MRQKRPIYAAKETYLCGKRDLFMRQKRHIYAAKETYLCGKRNLFMRQKKPIYAAKETCRRDLHKKTKETLESACSIAP